MKIFKTKSNKDVTLTLIEEVAEGLVYDLICDGHTHRVTVGLNGVDPITSLGKCADAHAEEVIKRELNKQKLLDAGLDVKKPKGVK